MKKKKYDVPHMTLVAIEATVLDAHIPVVSGGGDTIEGAAKPAGGWDDYNDGL